MNKLKGTVEKIHANKNVSLITVNVQDQTITAIVLDEPDQTGYAHIGNQLYLLFKETDVSLAKNITGELSICNQIPCLIDKIDQGNIFSAVSLIAQGFTLNSIITSDQLQKMKLSVNDQIVALIKSNEIMLMETEDT